MPAAWLLTLAALIPAGARAVDFDGARPARPGADWIRVLRGGPAPRPAARRLSSVAEAWVFSSGGELLPPAELWPRLAAARVVYAGERHDMESHHQVQLAGLKALHAAKPDLQVGLEMVDITQQGTLDDYLSGKIGDEEFKRFWQKAWGYPYELYRPILEHARARRIPVRGLNAPISIVRQVARGGLASLEPEQRRLLPAEIHPIRDPRYLEYVKRSLSEHGPLDPVRLGRMIEAMTVWNETMGQSVVDASARGPVLVIAGHGHMLYGAGIAESARSRADLAQAVLLPYPLDGERRPIEDLLKALRDTSTGEAALGDYFWLLPQ